MNKGLSYDDVLLKPKKTSVTDLENVETGTSLGSLELELPVLSAPMDTVTGEDMAKAMNEEGGLGVVHRFMPEEEQAAIVGNVDKVGAAVGLDELERVNSLIEEDVDMLVFDIAHGHHEGLLEFIEELQFLRDETVFCAGNVATVEAVEDYKELVDVLKVGVGPGSACTTREQTGCGVPQLTAVERCSGNGVDVVADGGVRKPGDMVKALMAGADAVMVGGVLSDTVESLRGGDFRGMASLEAAEDRSDRGLKKEDFFEEGESFENSEDGTVSSVLSGFEGGLKSGLSYCGSDSVEGARSGAEFVRVTGSTVSRNGAHFSD